MTDPLRIVVVPDLHIEDESDEHAIRKAERSRSLRIGLLENGFNLVASLPADVFLTERLAQWQPDMVIVDVKDARAARRPIVLFTNDSDTSHVKNAVAAGVSAYIVAGPFNERIRPILDVAMARFQHEQVLPGTRQHPHRTAGAKRGVARPNGRIARPKADRLRQRPADATPCLERAGRLRQTSQVRDGQRHESGRGGPAQARRG